MVLEKKQIGPDMDEKSVREIFFKNYKDDLNEALIMSVEEVTLAVIREVAPGELPPIISQIARARSYLDLIVSVVNLKSEVVEVLPSFVGRNDYLHQTLINSLEYLIANYESRNSYFKKQFSQEQLKTILEDRIEAFKKCKEVSGVRSLNPLELELAMELLCVALIGILGKEKVRQYAEIYNLCTPVLRQCQLECRVLEATKIKES